MGLRSWFKKIKNKLVSSKKENPELSLRIEGIELEDLPWWGTFQVAEEQSHYSKMGQIIVCIDRFNQGWRLASYRENEANSPQKTNKTLSAYFDQDTVTLKPALPDRTILFKLDCPLFIPPKTDLSLYTSTPVLIRIEIGTPPLLWEEIPTERLPDTWRGTNTQEGELCYAANTPASLRLDTMQLGTSYAVTAVSIINNTNEGIFLKEISIPVPFLSIYSDIHHQLWTELVKIVFEMVDQPETFMTQGSPTEMEDPTLISAARVPIKARFKKLFSTLRGN